MALKRGIVELENYNEKWKKEYEKERDLLKNVLGDRIIEIEHVGSTSIVGLKAKPVIDILIAINSLEEIEEIVPHNLLGVNVISIISSCISTYRVFCYCIINFFTFFIFW